MTEYLWKEKYLRQINLFLGKLITICDFWWLNSRPVTVKNATFYFHLLSWHFFLACHVFSCLSCFLGFQNFCFYYYLSFLDEVTNFSKRILTSQKTKCDKKL